MTPVVPNRLDAGRARAPESKCADGEPTPIDGSPVLREWIKRIDDALGDRIATKAAREEFARNALIVLGRRHTADDAVRYVHASRELAHAAQRAATSVLALKEASDRMRETRPPSPKQRQMITWIEVWLNDYADSSARESRTAQSEVPRGPKGRRANQATLIASIVTEAVARHYVRCLKQTPAHSDMRAANGKCRTPFGRVCDVLEEISLECDEEIQISKEVRKSIAARMKREEQRNRRTSGPELAEG
jgi:hypothetical protein